jgi:hypothetical protein
MIVAISFVLLGQGRLGLLIALRAGTDMILALSKASCTIVRSLD